MQLFKDRFFFLFQVKIWFQNRRTKWKKQEGISNAEAAEHKHTPEKSSSTKTKSSKTSKNSNKPLTDTPIAVESGNISNSINTSVLTVSLANGKIPVGEQNSEVSSDAMDLKPNPPLPENYLNPTVTHVSDEVSLTMDVVDGRGAERSPSVPLEPSLSPSQEQRGDHIPYPFIHNQMKHDRMSEPNSPICVTDSVVNCNEPFSTNSTIEQELVSVEPSDHH